ncbi:hypothetical protein [Streptomyces eurythermus]
MTYTAKALVATFGVAMFLAVSRGGQYIAEARWTSATAAYAVAGLCLAGLLREVGRALHDYTDDLTVPAVIRPLSPRRAAREARRASEGTCSCPRYWDTVGAEHDEWCPQRYRSTA